MAWAGLLAKGLCSHQWLWGSDLCCAAQHGHSPAPGLSAQVAKLKRFRVLAASRTGMERCGYFLEQITHPFSSLAQASMAALLPTQSLPPGSQFAQSRTVPPHRL